MPRVTVVIAARDAAGTLRETLESLGAQTFADWEAIVVDDASRDGTGELASGFDPRIEVVRNETALGPAGARNRGAELARAELIATLDADDLWKPDYLTRQVEAFDRARSEGRRVAVVCVDAELISSDGQPRGRWSERVVLPDEITLDVLLRENVVYNSVLMSRAVFLENGGYRQSMIWGEDFDLWLRLVEQGWEIVVSREPLAVYRLRPDALSADSARISAATAVVYEEALRRDRLSERQRSIANRQRRLHALLERRALLAGADGDALGAQLSRLRLVPAAARVALEHPERWLGWLRHGARRPAAGRHG